MQGQKTMYPFKSTLKTVTLDSAEFWAMKVVSKSDKTSEILILFFFVHMNNASLV